MAWTTTPPLTDGWTDKDELGGEKRYSEVGTLTYEGAGNLKYNSAGRWGKETEEVNPWD